ncbi:MAG: Mrp/NBP35 family ATP-binding protein [Alphaproteobacteria bacterium]|nr:Mrp/NBP35 family ATP-binding protein [Alphaproteobacteria bacterium]
MLSNQKIIDILCNIPFSNGETLSTTAISLMPDQKKLQIVITLPQALIAAEANKLQQEYVSALMDAGETRLVNIALTAERDKMQDTSKPKPAKKIILVGSGKGGVGKSTISLNLAVALSQIGKFRIGLLDADIYGPSMAQLLGITQKPDIENNRAMPIEKFGIKSISMGYLTTPQDAIIWRAPMVVKALKQFLFDVKWTDNEEELLDYLIIDLPPGTGDIPLSIAQQTKADGAVIITTGHDLSLIDASRAMKMFEKLNIPLIGMVENMAGFTCPHCGEVSHIFDVLDMGIQAKQHGTQLLGKIPLIQDLRGSADKQIPFMADNNTDANIRNIFTKISQNITTYLK